MNMKCLPGTSSDIVRALRGMLSLKEDKAPKVRPISIYVKGNWRGGGGGGLENIPPVYSKLRASAGRTQMDAGSEINADLGNRGGNTLILNCWIDWEFFLNSIQGYWYIRTQTHTHTQRTKATDTQITIGKIWIWNSFDLKITPYSKFWSFLFCRSMFFNYCAIMSGVLLKIIQFD